MRYDNRIKRFDEPIQQYHSIHVLPIGCGLDPYPVPSPKQYGRNLLHLLHRHQSPLGDHRRYTSSFPRVWVAEGNAMVRNGGGDDGDENSIDVCRPGLRLDGPAQVQVERVENVDGE